MEEKWSELVPCSSQDCFVDASGLRGGTELESLRTGGWICSSMLLTVETGKLRHRQGKLESGHAQLLEPCRALFLMPLGEYPVPCGF